MSLTTRPVFIVGTGRCGTRAIYKMLLGAPGVEAHHEYLSTHVQRDAILYAMNLVSSDAMRAVVSDIYGAAIHYSPASIWANADNRASWMMGLVQSMFPTAKFVILYRDGRKVTSSFLHKLGAECCDDLSMRALLSWLDGDIPRRPPPDKPYWWRVPRGDELFADEFPTWSQFQRICYHWLACNQVIKWQLQFLTAGSYLEVRLEDLTTDLAQVERLAEFVGVPPTPDHFKSLQTPVNVGFPMDFQLTPEQLEQFQAICGPMMETLGYAGKESYAVKY